MLNIRPAAIAGSFYPYTKQVLERDVHALLDDAKVEKQIVAPKAIIVPHAGYIYSGPTAAAAYASLEGIRKKIRRVVLLGPVHRIPIRGLALPGADAFETPLGQVELDQAAIASLAGMHQVNVPLHALLH